MKKLLLALLAQVFCLNLFAVPANPEPVTFLQSDGSELTVHLRGDEFFSWFETVDGYTLLRKENNDFVYAQLNQSDELSPTNFLAQNPNNRTLEEQNFLQNLGQRVVSKSDNIRKAVEQKNARHLERKNSIVPKNETIGTRQQIVVLAEYQDVRFLTSYSGTTWTGTQLFDSIMNGKNYTVNSARGSVQKYYQDNSLGQLTIETTVYGPVLLPRNRAWYGGNNQSGNDSNDRQMIRDALYILDTMSIDLTPFVNSGTGFVDGVHIIFAGCGEENPSCTSNAIWSHKWTLPEQPIYGGAQFYTYSCSPEVGGGNTSTTPTHIGVIAHEIGHTLGLWDMYDTYNGPFKGLGPWSVMADGAWNYSGRTPPYLNSFERFQLAWTTPIVLDYDAYYEITLPPLGVNDVSYVFYAKDASGNPIPNERFYLENRNTASSGGWDSQIYSNGGPATGGLMVYHMDSTNSTPWLTNNINSSNSAAGANPSGRENFKILSAKGTNSNYNLDPFSQSTMDSLTDNSTPNTQSWAGIPSNMPIKHIARNTSNNTVSFTVGHEPPCVETSFAFDDFFCQGGGYDFNGRWITAAGTYVDTVQNSAGCDSIITLNLVRHNNSPNVIISETIFEGDSIRFFGIYYKIAGTYNLDSLNSVGCDSTITLILTVVPPVSIKSIIDSEILKIIPNPVKINQEFVVIIPVETDNYPSLQNTKIEIFCITGELVFSKSIHHETDIKMPGIKNPGTYILRVGTKSVKIVVIP